MAGFLHTAAIVGISQLIVYISNPIYMLNSNLAELKNAKGPIEKLMGILNSAPDMGGNSDFSSENLDLVVENLSFSYGERKILCGFNYTFRQGGKYLIVGPSGCGKSTLLHLLAGLQRQYSGSITLGQTELQDIKRELLTENLCYITQEPFLFDDTLYKNVCLFSDIDETRVFEVLSQVGLRPFVEALPDGLHSALGENAASISGGEKQRVAIARSLIRSPSIILLDECTSHLDRATAIKIERLVMNLEGVTVLLVSHNATDVAKELADDIIQIKE